MQKIEKELLGLLETIQGSGAFAVSGVKGFVFPGLHIQGVGEIGFPMIPAQVREIIGAARKAPFGKGSRTITDTTVRNAWEIDADRLSFQNSNWKEFINDLLAEVKQQLGIENKQISASLYKLLIYEEGDFFLPHKDSEKEQGMFASLVIGLPSAHTGGVLTIRFDGRATIVDFSGPAGNYQIPYAAFYADCEHEIEPVESGYRVCLTYNLLQLDETEKIGGPQFGAQVDEMTSLLKHMSASFDDKPKAILLAHQYTPANFSLPQLKRHDRPRAEALIEAAAKAGYFAKLGLVTYYQIGELEGGGFDNYYSRRNRYRRYYEEDEEEEGTMGEIHEEYIDIKHWSDDELPGLGGIHIPEENIFATFELGENEPIEKEAEGYTGNAGMTMQYWYHYGAVFLWPRRIHAGVLEKTSDVVRLQWLDYYLRQWNNDLLEPHKNTRRLITSFSSVNTDSLRYYSIDFSPVADALIQLNDETFLKDQATPVLTVLFVQIDVEKWATLLQSFPPAIFQPVFEQVAVKGDVKAVDHLLKVLGTLDKLSFPAIDLFVERIVDYISNIALSKVYEPSPYHWRQADGSRKDPILSIIGAVLALSAHKEKDDEWLKSLLQQLTLSFNRPYVNEILAPTLLTGQYRERVLAKALRDACMADLTARTKVKPTPPSDWRREVPSKYQGHKIWEMLRSFLESPTQKVFDYRANQYERGGMESVVGSVDIDLKMETITSGRPYTLRLTKTQAAYDKALRHWQEDVVLLERLQKLRDSP